LRRASTTPTIRKKEGDLVRTRNVNLTSSRERTRMKLTLGRGLRREERSSVSLKDPNETDILAGC